jgi:hypothetical protein
VFFIETPVLAQEIYVPSLLFVLRGLIPKNPLARRSFRAGLLFILEKKLLAKRSIYGKMLKSRCNPANSKAQDLEGGFFQ